VSADPADAIRRRDEILQVMYWMRGEGLADAAGVQELQTFLDEETAPTLEEDLAALEDAGLLESAGGGRFRLTRRGAEEGGRRFLEDFEELMHQGHGACSDPDCDCHALGPEACAHAHA
jgi:DNA-binding transcriptional ArsR family regulator